MAVIYTRKATIDDLDKIMSIVEDARELFKNDKIPQWQGSYPDEERFKEDINNEEAYVLIVGDEVAGIGVLTTERQENYNAIEEGSWKRDDDYAAIHRAAISSKFRGMHLSSYLFSGLITIGVQKGYKDFRIDTHPGNERMKGLSEKFGFEKRGIIYVDEKIEPIRYAYELNL